MRRTACLTIFMLAAASAAFAQEGGREEAGPDPEAARQEEAAQQEELEAAIEEAETVVITAGRGGVDPFGVPYAVSVVRKEAAARARMGPDAIKELPGVHLQRTSYGQASPLLRGLTGYHTLLLIDGIRLNNSTWRSGPNEYFGLVDGRSAARFELLLGPAAVIHGSDGVGGALDVLPRRRALEGGTDFGGRIVLRFATAENSLSGRAEVSGNVDDVFGFVLGGTVSSFDDLEAGGDVGRQPHTGYGSDFEDASLTFRLDEDWTLGILAQRARLDDVRRTHATVYGVSYHGTTVGTDRRRNLDFDRDLLAVLLDGEGLDGPFDEVRVRLSYQRHEELEDRVRSNGNRSLSSFEVDTFGAVVELVSETALGRFTFKADYYHDDVDSARRSFDAAGVFTGSGIQGQVADDAAYDLFGLFVQDEIALHDDVDLVLGGRFTYAAADADRVEDPVGGGAIGIEDDWVDLVGSARMLWRAVPELHLYGGVSQGFRAPNLSDLTRLDVARSGELEVPTSGLDPEDFLSFEVGGKARFGGLSLEAAYHYTIIDDLIIRQPTGMMIGGDLVVVKRNAGDGHVQGVELGARYAFDENWSVFGSFAWTDGQVDTFPTSAPLLRTEVLDRLPPIQGRLGAQWDSDDRQFWVRASAQIVDAQDRLSTANERDTQRIPPGGTPGYTIYNLEAGFRPWDDTEIFVALENLTDKNYRIHGSGVQEPGINLVIGADVSF